MTLDRSKVFKTIFRLSQKYICLAHITGIPPKYTNTVYLLKQSLDFLKNTLVLFTLLSTGIPPKYIYTNTVYLLKQSLDFLRNTFVLLTLLEFHLNIIYK